MITAVDSDLSGWNSLMPVHGQVALWWLGQAGFLFKSSMHMFVVDPYLSDSLAVKYRDKRFKHIRMMPVPIAPTSLTGLDWIFCTHRHTDHMDVGTLPSLVDVNPGARLFAPAAAEGHLVDFIGIDSGIAELVNAGDHIRLDETVEIDVVASAHEDLQYDENGSAVFLGYVFTIGGVKIYHSGDCVLYDGLAERLNELDVDIALLPVNGQDSYRKDNGIPGNFTFEEAVSLCLEAGIRTMIPHHFGMFDFNTVDPSVLAEKAAERHRDLEVVLPHLNNAFIADAS